MAQSQGSCRLSLAIAQRLLLVAGFGLAILLVYCGVEAGARAYPVQPILYAAGVIVALCTAAALYRLARAKLHESDSSK
jgi:hypothetical protein